MKKLITVISITLALALTLFSFSSCSPKIIQGTIVLPQPDDSNVIKFSNDTAVLVDHYDSFEDFEKTAINGENTIVTAKVEVIGDSFNAWRVAPGWENCCPPHYWEECVTLASVRIKEIYFSNENADIKVGDIIYMSHLYVYVDEDYYNNRLKDTTNGGTEENIGKYYWAGADYAIRMEIFEKGREYFVVIGPGSVGFGKHNYETLEKDGIEFKFYFATYIPPIPLDGKINRNLYSDYQLMLYDGAIAKYGNKEVLE